MNESLHDLAIIYLLKHDPILLLTQLINFPEFFTPPLLSNTNPLFEPLLFLRIKSENLGISDLTVNLVIWRHIRNI